MTETQPDNPLLRPWTGPFEAPPFPAIEAAHFRPAFDAALDEARKEISAIAADADPPSFANTIEALERSGRALDRVSSVFFNLASADSNDAIEAIEREVAPLLARHRNEVFLNRSLYDRVDALWAKREGLDLDAEQIRLLERTHVAFSRAGAGLADEIKARLAAIGERLATLGAQFGQNVLADEKAWLLVLETPDDLAGLPDWFVASAASAATERGLPGKHVVTLSRSSVEPFLQFSARRDLREKAFAAWAARGEHAGPTDNRADRRRDRAAARGIREAPRIRELRAVPPRRLDGQDACSRARSPRIGLDAGARARRRGGGGAGGDRGGGGRQFPDRAVGLALLCGEAPQATVRRRRGRDQALFPAGQADRGGVLHRGAAVRPQLRRALRHSALPPRRPLVDGSRAGRRAVALFIGDYFARPSKRSGAWMSAFRKQEKLDGVVLPIVVNVLNLAKGGDGGPPLLGFDEARTLFHEFGHALHGMLSDVTYPLLSGTRVATDFVEFPSQLYEHWLEQPEILRRFAVHRDTGEPLPEAMLERLIAAQRFNQGFATVEYAASALVDLGLHERSGGAGLDVVAFERQELERLGMPQAIAMRHRTPHFQHIFSGGGYASGYYSYLWSEALDADGFEAFEESGDIFSPALARRLRDLCLFRRQ